MKFPDKVLDLCKMLNANKAQDIVVCDSTKMQNPVDFFIIATATSNVHIRTIVEDITKKTSENCEEFESPLREGFGLSNWVVLSFENVYLHLFTKEERNRYNLEKLLNDGKNLMTFKRLLNIIKADEKKTKASLKKAHIKEQKEKKNENRSQKELENKVNKKEKNVKLKKEKVKKEKVKKEKVKKEKVKQEKIKKIKKKVKKIENKDKKESGK